MSLNYGYLIVYIIWFPVKCMFLHLSHRNCGTQPLLLHLSSILDTTLLLTREFFLLFSRDHCNLALKGLLPLLKRLVFREHGNKIC